MRVTTLAHTRRWRARLALTMLAVPGVIMAGSVSALASPAAAQPGAAPSAAAPPVAAPPVAAPHVAAPPAAARAGKPVPVRPPSSPGAGLGAAIPAKPHGARASQPRPLTAWTVTLTASPNWLWPTQYSTLTATASMNVGPTPYYLRIYDETAHAYVVTCATGTTCSTAVTEPTPQAHHFIAVVSDASAAYPPGSVQATSSDAGVTWQGVSLSLSAGPTTLPVGSAATLTATTSADIGPSPFWTEIFDLTTHTRVGVCGFGTSCSAVVSQGVATTHEYVAYLSANSAAYPPPSIQETSADSFITWSNLGWRVSLSAPAGTFGSETVTATANANVGPTPYYIEIFDENGTRLAECPSGSTCSVNFTPSYFGSRLVAFVSAYSTTLPPAGIVASSNVVTTFRRLIP
jgi:hypothetical protein